jgi:hypothetical protein
MPLMAVADGVRFTRAANINLQLHPRAILTVFWSLRLVELGVSSGYVNLRARTTVYFFTMRCFGMERSVRMSNIPSSVPHHVL